MIFNLVFFVLFSGTISINAMENGTEAQIKEASRIATILLRAADKNNNNIPLTGEESYYQLLYNPANPIEKKSYPAFDKKHVKNKRTFTSKFLKERKELRKKVLDAKKALAKEYQKAEVYNYSLKIDKTEQEREKLDVALILKNQKIIYAHRDIAIELENEESDRADYSRLKHGLRQ